MDFDFDDVKVALTLLGGLLIAGIILLALVAILVLPCAYLKADRYNKFCKPKTSVTLIDALILDLNTANCGRTIDVNLDKSAQ